MTWILVDAASGVVLADDLADEPTVAAGQRAHIKPRDPDMQWDVARQGFFKTSLPDRRALRWEEVKAARDRAEWWGCATPFGRVDTDPESQRKVSGATTMAMIAASAGQPFAIDWTMQDNLSVVHDGPAMITMGVAVGQHVAACHAVALAKRAAIDAADDLAAIAAVDVDKGWPDAPA